MRVTWITFGKGFFRSTTTRLCTYIRRLIILCFKFFFFSNYLGNKAWTLNLDWDGKADFNAADEHEWEGIGLARTANGLTFLQVYDAGHMVRQ